MNFYRLHRYTTLATLQPQHASITKIYKKLNQQVKSTIKDYSSFPSPLQVYYTVNTRKQSKLILSSGDNHCYYKKYIQIASSGSKHKNKAKLFIEIKSFSLSCLTSISVNIGNHLRLYLHILRQFYSSHNLSNCFWAC